MTTGHVNLLAAVGPDIALTIASLIVFLLMLAGICYFVWWCSIDMAAKLRQCRDDLKVHRKPVVGDVNLDFETCHSFAYLAVYTRHNFWLPAEDARTLLSRLFWFNLTCGLSPGRLLILPIKSIVCYFIQLRSIAHQEEQGGWPFDAAPTKEVERSDISDA